MLHFMKMLSILTVVYIVISSTMISTAYVYLLYHSETLNFAHIQKLRFVPRRRVFLIMIFRIYCDYFSKWN
jgi:hypothetical protein